MRTSEFLWALAFAAVLAIGAPATAHHSGAGFNSDKVIELTGTIKEFQFTNPHTWIQIIVEDDKGAKGVRTRWDGKASGRRRSRLGPK
jgi:Family of unknown function (DUF6152)